MNRIVHWSLGIGLAAGLGLSGVAAAAQQPPPPTQKPPAQKPPADTPQKAPTADAKFLQECTADGLAEIQLADLAASKSASADVKALAAKIKADHTAANDRLRSLASTKQVTLSSALPAAHKSPEDRLSKLEGAAFDRAYLDAMIRDHQKAISTFQGRTKSSDAEIKAFATDTLPALQDHLRQAQALRKQVK